MRTLRWSSVLAGGASLVALRCCSRPPSPRPPSAPQQARMTAGRRPAARRLHPRRRRSPPRRRARPPRRPAQQRLPLHARADLGNRSRGVRVADPRPRRHAGRCASADVGRASPTPVTAITPSSYNLGVSVGWRRFAISGDVAQIDGGTAPGRARMRREVGMSYRATQRLTGRVAVGAERAEGAQRIIAEDEAYHARCRRRLLDRPQRRCHRRRPLPHRRATGSSRCARRPPRQPGRLCRHRLPLLSRSGAAQASIPAQP